MDLTAENLNELIAQTQRQDVEIRFLKQKVQFLMGKLFGAGSETLSPDQLAFAFGEESAAPGTPEAIGCRRQCAISIPSGWSHAEPAERKTSVISAISV